MIFTLHQSTIDNSAVLKFVANPYTGQDEQDQAWEAYDMLQNAGFQCYLACYGKYDNAVEMFPTPVRTQS